MKIMKLAKRQEKQHKSKDDRSFLVLEDNAQERLVKAGKQEKRFRKATEDNFS